MVADIDWQRELARAGSHTQSSLVNLAIRAGYTVVPGKGSHFNAIRPGIDRPITIQSKMYGYVARNVIKALQRGAM